MKLKSWIKRAGLTGRAVVKALGLGEQAGVEYCKQYRDLHRTLPKKVEEDSVPPDNSRYVDQVIVHRGFPSESISAKDIYFLAFPSRAIEYLHCTKERRIQIGVLAQQWTNARISPASAGCRCHTIVATNPQHGSGKRPRLLEFVPFGGTHTKTGHTKVFSWASVKAQFAAEGIPLR
ncbi:MAG: hypothetical protein J6S75_01955 [Thermoguttaceae bacterium]|nr:hypothetical protein [Thermoguttaceae bacterium]